MIKPYGLALLLTAAAAAPALATPTAIAPIEKNVPVGTSTLNLTDTLANITLAFSNANESGTVNEIVAKDATTGDLDFYFQIANAVSSNDSVERFTVTNFGAFTDAVAYVPNTGVVYDTTTSSYVTGDLAPTTADDTSKSGNSIGFNFGNLSVDPGTKSDYLEVLTNATVYGAGTYAIIDGATSTIPDFGPVAAPEPSTWALLAGTFGILLTWIRWRALVRP